MKYNPKWYMEFWDEEQPQKGIRNSDMKDNLVV